MRRRIQTVSKTFRIAVPIADDLSQLAESLQRHPAEIIREAVTLYVHDHLTRLAKEKQVIQ